MIATQITASTQVSSMEIKQTKKIFLVTGMTPSMLGTKKSDRTFVVLVVSLQRHHFSSFFGVRFCPIDSCKNVRGAIFTPTDLFESQFTPF